MIVLFLLIGANTGNIFANSIFSSLFNTFISFKYASEIRLILVRFSNVVSVREYGMYTFTRRGSSEVLIRSIMSDKPDVVILELTLKDTDALTLISTLREKLDELPGFIVISDLDNRFIEKQVLSNGASYYLTKPYHKAELAEAVRSLATRSSKKSLNDLELMVTDVIRRVGMPANVKGYYYLRSAIMKAADNRYILEGVTKNLYPAVARQFNTTSSRVERAMRHAIETAWVKSGTEAFVEAFGCPFMSERDRPTNSEFIALAADKLRLQMRTIS